ncbi:MAG: sulfate adenylyltransferase [Nanoarchaeota archaeon]
MLKKVKIICTIGPSSNYPEILERFKDRGVDFFRINLSHTEEDDIDQRIKDLLGYGPSIILDTEGSQIRSGNIEDLFLREGEIIKLFSSRVKCDSNKIFLSPEGIIRGLEVGDLISIDFNSLLLRVFDTTTKENGYISCKAIIGGLIGARKAVHIDSQTFSLSPFSKKDYKAIELAKKYGILHFTLSFMESPESVIKFKQIYPNSIVYSKIESKKGLKNFLEITKVSDGILIDRGDLGTQIPLEKIPFAQKLILKKVKEFGKEAFIATNTLEQMAFALKPNKAEVNDIINSILDGATGIALTKETAIGKYPVETVNILLNLFNQIELLNKEQGENIIEKIEKINYLESDNFPELLIKPHGGVLINRFNPNYKGPLPIKKIEINEETLMDLENLAIGAFSPLDGFMDSKDFNSVINDMRLTNNIIWPLPIFLAVNEDVKSSLIEGENIALTKNGEIRGILHLKEIYKVDKELVVDKIYGTKDPTHPGVKNFLECDEFFLGGGITLLKKRISDYRIHEFTPNQTRKIFSERGWSKVVGFHTRNVIHRSHEFIQLEAMKRGLCDGLFIHPVVGSKKSGDFQPHIIIKTYEEMMNLYPKSKVVMGTFLTHSRYAGPREALFTALVRKNFGCSHFIVGRDHTGVGNFYHPKSSHEIFDKFNQEELGIIPIKFGNVFYSNLENKYVHELDFVDHPEDYKMNISGTEIRKLLQAGKPIPNWFMRPKISKIIIDKIKNGEKVFVE